MKRYKEWTDTGYGIDKDAGRKEDMTEYCVLCRRPTRYRRDTPIDARKCYIIGAGQLCGRCYWDLYEAEDREDG